MGLVLTVERMQGWVNQGKQLRPSTEPSKWNPCKEALRGHGIMAGKQSLSWQWRPQDPRVSQTWNMCQENCRCEVEPQIRKKLCVFQLTEPDKGITRTFGVWITMC